MILRPLLSNAEPAKTRPGEFESAWAVVARTQSVETSQYLLIGQPDHARLSGELSALFRAPFLPEINETISKAIGAHDDGWARFPFERELHGELPRTSTGRPQHFMQVSVEQSLLAWTGSIKAAAAISRLGEYMVSGHFSRIGRSRMQMQVDTEEDLLRMEEFVSGQENWQRDHEAEIGLSQEQLSEYVDLLQLCDLLSLYLCCGATQAAEFPQKFNTKTIRICFEDGSYSTEPSLFGGTAQCFYLPARIYPSSLPESAGEDRTQVDFQIR